MSRPNVLLMTTDHWPAALLGAAGHPIIQTPTLDELARCGTRFPNAYSECPICIPARRTLMTGLTPRSHGDRTFQTTLRMPNAPTLAGTFRQAGYQTYAVGKLHVYPQRDRIGFDDVLLAEEGRPQWGVVDDYELFLGDQGFAGRQFDHGMSNNQYVSRPWHLLEETHVTNWSAKTMSRMIRRRDPNRPGFWYLSFTHPHPPLVPLQQYLDFYQRLNPPDQVMGEWTPSCWDLNQSSNDSDSEMPWLLRSIHEKWNVRTDIQFQAALRAFYALCTHIDHQIRVVLGTLREEGLLDDTVIMFTADHGDMLGNHGLWAKRLYYEGSANVPMILVEPDGSTTMNRNATDNRLVGLQDVMPTLLDLAGVEVPKSCDGRSMVSGESRSHLYGECNEGMTATRMVHDGRYKLIYYSAGNKFQLFDLDNDAKECDDLSASVDHQEALSKLKEIMRSELYDTDLDWIDDAGNFVGLPNDEEIESGQRGLFLQRGTHWPPPPVNRPEE